MTNIKEAREVPTPPSVDINWRSSKQALAYALRDIHRREQDADFDYLAASQALENRDFGEMIYDLGHNNRGSDDFPTTLRMNVSSIESLQPPVAMVSVGSLASQLAGTIDGYLKSPQEDPNVRRNQDLYKDLPFFIYFAKHWVGRAARMALRPDYHEGVFRVMALELQPRVGFDYVSLSPEGRRRARPFAERAETLANSLLEDREQVLGYGDDPEDESLEVVIIQSGNAVANTKFAGAELQVAKPYRPADTEDVWGKRIGSEQFTFYPSGLLIWTTQLRAPLTSLKPTVTSEGTTKWEAQEANYEEAARLFRILNKIQVD